MRRRTLLVVLAVLAVAVAAAWSSRVDPAPFHAPDVVAAR
jgi:hypothetical protein